MHRVTLLTVLDDKFLPGVCVVISYRNIGKKVEKQLCNIYSDINYRTIYMHAHHEYRDVHILINTLINTPYHDRISVIAKQNKRLKYVSLIM